jgi:hypothetical protein
MKKLFIALLFLLPILCNAQLNKNIWKVSAIQFFAGATDGANQAYLFHYSNSGKFEKWGIAPNEVAWKNKWATDINGNVIVGQERFWLSSSSLVFLTDFHHATRFVKHRLDETSLLYYATGHRTKKFYWSSSSKESRKIKKKEWYWYVADIAISFTVRSIGFYITYDVIFK